MFFRKINFFIVVIFYLQVSGCELTKSKGQLSISYIGDGTFEIYKIASEQPLQFVSETTGKFNEKLSLNPGSYMVLADCSSETINIYPGSNVQLAAHQINFMPMTPVQEHDKFTIQCVRSERTHFRQNLHNHFSLAILTGARDLLVGMVPLHLNLTNDGSTKDFVQTFPLSKISVESTTTTSSEDFFVSPIGSVTPYTENQTPGSNLFILKGTYDLQLNGTEMVLELGEGQSRTIKPGTITVQTSPHANISAAEKVNGMPLYVEINGDHYMNLNTTYPILPGSLDVKLASSIRPKAFQVKEGEHLKIHAKNIIVELGCTPDDWACLGSKKIKLFEKDKNYHFAESQTDEPLLYFEKDVAIGVEGSRNIKYVLSNADDQKMRIGYLEIVPTPMHRPGILTDLMRVETNGGGLTGSSLDMVLDKTTIMPLLTGTYHLAQYTFVTSDGSRHKTSQSITITPGQTVKLEVQTYLSEKRMAVIEGERDDNSKQ